MRNKIKIVDTMILEFWLEPCGHVRAHSRFSYLDLLVNSLNLARRKLHNNYHGFTKEFNFFLLEWRVLSNWSMGKPFSSQHYVQCDFSFVELSKFSGNIQIGKTQLNQTEQS